MEKFSIRIVTFSNCSIAVKAHKFVGKLSISGGDRTPFISINLSQFGESSISFTNANIINSNRDKRQIICFKSLELYNASFIEKINSITCSTFTSDSISLNCFQIITTEKLELYINEGKLSNTLFFVTKGCCPFFSTEFPQVEIFNSRYDCDIIFGVNSLQFMLRYNKISYNYKIVTQYFPVINIENLMENNINFKCHSNLTSNSLLTPTINMRKGNCSFYCSNWPRNPRPFKSHWVKNQFFDHNLRSILVFLDASSNIYVYGNNIPISIKSNGKLSIYPMAIECGITGKVYVQTEDDEIWLKNNKNSTFSVGEIVNLTSSGMLKSNNNLLTVYIGVCTNTFIFDGSSYFVCRSIDNSNGKIKKHVILEKDGNITNTIGINSAIVFQKIYSLLEFKPIGNFYKENGDLNFQYILNYILNTLEKNKGKGIVLFSTLKTLGNEIFKIPQITTSGKHTITVKRNDLMNALFYFNVFKYNKELVCGNHEFNLSEWNVIFEDFTYDTNYPFFQYMSDDFNFSINNHQENETFHCLRMRTNNFPHSAIEFLIITDNSHYSWQLSWLSGIGVIFVLPKNLKKIKSHLTNPAAKNIILILMSDITGSLDLTGLRKDANVMIVGMSTSLLGKLMNGDFDINLSEYMPTLKIAHDKLSCLTLLNSKVQNEEINAKYFISVANYYMKEKINVKSEEIILDFHTLNKIDKSGNFKVNDMTLLPFDLNIYEYQTIQKVDFLKDKWKLLFSNSSFDIEYESIKQKLFIMTGIHKTLSLNVNEETPQNLRPIKIGYDIGLEKNLTKQSTIPLLGTPEGKKDKKKYFYHPFPNILKNHLIINEYIYPENVTFVGNWGRIQNFTDFLEYNSISPNLKITNFPMKLEEQIKIRPIYNVLYDQINSSIMKLSLPQIIQNKRKYIIPNNSSLIFDNITVLSKDSSVVVRTDDGKHQSVHTNNLIMLQNSTCQIENISISNSLELESGSHLIVDFMNPNNIEIIMHYCIDDSYPLITLNNVPNNRPNKIVLDFVHSIRNSKPKEISDFEILNDYSSQPNVVMEIKSFYNLCNEWLPLFSLSNSASFNFSKYFSIFCFFEKGTTIFGTNISVDVKEGSVKDKYISNQLESPSNLLPFVATVCLFVILIIISAYIEYCKGKHTHCDSGDFLTEKRNQLNDISAILNLNESI